MHVSSQPWGSGPVCKGQARRPYGVGPYGVGLYSRYQPAVWPAPTPCQQGTWSSPVEPLPGDLVLPFTLPGVFPVRAPVLPFTLPGVLA
jgi:hypothetical protein